MMLLSKLTSPAVSVEAGEGVQLTQPSCNRNPVEVTIFVKDSHVNVSLACSVAGSDATQQLASMTQSAATEQQANPTGSGQPAGAVSAEQPLYVSGYKSQEQSGASVSHDSAVAPRGVPLNPTAVPKHMLASHALSLASSSVLDGSDEEEDVKEADGYITDRPEASTSICHSSNTSPLKQSHGQAEAKGKRKGNKQAMDDPLCPRRVSGGTNRDQDQDEPARHGRQQIADLCSTTNPDHSLGLMAFQLSANESMANTANTYQLTAAVVHHGSASNSGHYTVYRLAGPHYASAAPAARQWYSISDEVVQPVDVHEVLACEATLLFYGPRSVGSAA